MSWALSDVCCDVCIVQSKKPEEVMVRTCPNPQDSCSCPNNGYKLRKIAAVDCGRLSPEQNALISGIVSLLFALSLPFWYDKSILTNNVLDWQVLTGLLAGGLHFLAYCTTLMAFNSTSSTVITPLLQLSALWMLPLSAFSSFVSETQLIHPVHLFAVLLIVVGGFLPAAEGNCSAFFTMRFWSQSCVIHCMLGEFLISLYNLLLHKSTYDVSDDEGLGAVTFFVYSRIGNALTCFLLYALVPQLNASAKSLLDVRVRFALVAFAGEFLSTCGVLIVTFGYSQFYEPSIVNAAEGGLQQLFNLLFAVAAERYMPSGISSRKVDNLNTKLFSFAMVTSGLILSQWERKVS